MGKAAKTPVRVKVLVTGQPMRRRHRPLSEGRLSRLLTRLLTVGMISGVMATAATGIGVALRLIIDPGSVGWVHWIIPGWEQQPLIAKILQTPSDIEAEAAKADLIVGEPIYFSTYPGLSKDAAGFQDFLLPFYTTDADCPGRSGQRGTAREISGLASETCSLSELRVYRPLSGGLRLPGRASLELVDRLSVTGPEELAAVAPLINAGIADQRSSQRLPLTTVTFVKGNAPLPGIWFHVSGEWQRGSNRTLYGQVVRYDSTRDRLQSLLAWTSPAEEFPNWQQVTGGDATELVVNQTIGLEPQFQVYQLAALTTPGKPIQIKPIDLRESVLENRTYEHGLLLARHGLWSTALQILERSRNTNAEWTTMAQSQIDLVALHAKVTQAQAEREWSSPAQQINALLIDGRWADALTVLRTAHANGYTTSNLLSDPADRLWHRVEAAVRVNPQLDVLNWGALLTAVRQDRQAAITWLQHQAKTSGDRQAEQVLALLDPLPITTVASTPTPAAPTPNAHTPLASTVPVSTVASTVVSAPSIIGTATLQRAIDPVQWLPSDPATLTLAPDQTWYEIQVIGFQDGPQWRQSALPDLVFGQDITFDQDTTQTAQLLWQRLGLNHDATLQLITWAKSEQPHILPVTVIAVRVMDGKVQLLATGAQDTELASGASTLAMTLATISWMEPLNTATLAALTEQPLWSETLVPALWHTLQQTPNLLPASITDAGTMLREFGGWSVQLMELTGDDHPEAVLTLQAESAPVAPLSPLNAAQTLIFSSNGSLLYSDLSQTGQSLQAIVDLGGAQSPGLIISNAQGYGIERWSAQNQRFE